MPRPRDAAQVRALMSKPPTALPSNSVPSVAVDGATATIRLFEPVDDYGGWWGMSAEELAYALDGLPSNVTEIRLLINSPGGAVFDAVAMMSTLAAHPARVVAVVQGLAASAATFMAVGADELVMYPGSMLMIHDAWVVTYGNAAELRAQAELLDKISTNIAGLYARKAGGTVAEWRDLMIAETWYTAEEAVAAGLADRVAEASEDDAPVGTDGPPADDPAAPGAVTDSADELWLAAEMFAETFGVTASIPGTDSKIDPDLGEDVDATGAGDPIGCLDLMSMQLALVST